MHISIQFDDRDPHDGTALAKALAAVAVARSADEHLTDILSLHRRDEPEPIPERYMVYLASNLTEAGAALDEHCAANIDLLLHSMIAEPMTKSRRGVPHKLHLTQTQIDDLVTLIRSHYRIRIFTAPQAWDIDPVTERRWKVAGVIRPDVRIAGMVHDAFVAGRLQQIIDDGMSITEMRKMAREWPMPREASLTMQAITDTVNFNMMGGLGYQAEKTATGYIYGQQAEHVATIAALYRTGDLKYTPTNRNDLSPDEMAAIQTDKTVEGWRGLARELRNRMAATDRERDWERVAVSVLRLSKNIGSLSAMAEDGTAYCYYDVHMNACGNCKKLYLNLDGSPKVFAVRDIMRDVIANGGMNMNRKASQIGKADGWQPTALAHPWCQCRPYRVIPGITPKGRQ